MQCYQKSTVLNNQESNAHKIGDLHTYNFLSKNLLGIYFNCELKFNKHIKDFCQKSSRKLNVLSRLASYIGVTKTHTLINGSFKLQFSFTH